MSDLNKTEALEKAQEAADDALKAANEAMQAAEEAQSYADAIANNVEAGAETAAAALEAGAQALGGSTGIDPFMFRFAIFVLAIFIGYFVVWNVTPALHTPLMAVTNAISSVIVVGALVGVAAEASGVASGFGLIALILASVNIFGGFLVTQRMLAMYRKKN